MRYRYRTVIKSLTIAVFLFVIGLPLVLICMGQATSGSLSYEQTFTLEKPNAENVLSGEFRDSFENWLSHSYPFRRDVLLAYNQLEYTVEAFTLGGGDSGVTEETTAVTEVLDASDTTAETEVHSPYLDTNPLYTDVNKTRYERVLEELSGYKGTNTVIIGKSGYLYENGYINEYLGYSSMYPEVTEARVIEQVERFEYIQNELEKLGVAFVFVITPSKASQYPEAIPDWYKLQNVTPDNYVRPYTYLVNALADSTVNYIDSASLYEEVGLQETFPKTGTHWNKLAAFETMKAILQSYTEQTDEKIRMLDIAKVLSSKSTPGYGNPEQDIYGAVYSAIPSTVNIVDDLYYQPDIYVVDPDEDNQIEVFLQGGSFAHDINYYFDHYGISSGITRVYYNQTKMTDGLWRRVLKSADYIVMECNEQFVRSLGGDAPVWSNDKKGYDIGYDIIQSLYDYLKAQEGAAE